MIDFDPNTQIALMSQDVAMKFMVWAGYYNGLELEEGSSFRRFTRGGKPLFARADAERLDRLQSVLFKCFDCISVSRAMASLKKAKELGEPCPFTEESLNNLFGTTLKP